MAPSTPLKIPNVTDPDRLVLSRGNLFCVTTTTGDLAPAGARDLGLFHADTRHLSHYLLALPQGTPVKLSSANVSAVVAQIDLTATDIESGGMLDEPVNFLHVRRKQLLDEAFVEKLVLTNFLGHGVDVEFELIFAADFADIFEVRGARRERRGEHLPPRVEEDHVELRYQGRCGFEYRTLLRFTPAPIALDAERARFRLHLAPGEAQVQEVVVSPTRGAARPRALVPFDLREKSARREERQFRRASTAFRSDNRIFQQVLERALADVHALRVEHDGRWIVGAGIPWFAAPFGRDSIITSIQMLAFAPALAAETLRFLARYQGTKDDPNRDEEPGKIMHELRRGEMALCGEIPHDPYYGSVDATPLYVILAGEMWRWTADRALLEEVWPAVLRAMQWMDAQTRNGTAFLTYKRRAPRGMDNQGWKDSRDGVSFPDGRRAAPPIALVEVQGYVVDAYRSAARLAEALGDVERAAAWGARVEPMRRAIEDAFWCEQTRFYALALDGEGRQVPTLSSNPGHLLWSRVPAPERAARVTEVLLSPEMDSGWGIRTVARGQSIYNPISYHNGTVWPHDNAIAAIGMARYGMHAQALGVLEAMFSACRLSPHFRLAELFCGMGRSKSELLVKYPVSCSPQAWAAGAMFMMLQGVLGLDAHANQGRLRIWNPTLPQSVKRLDLRNIQVGGSRVGLRFARTVTRTHVDVLDVRGAPLRLEIEIG